MTVGWITLDVGEQALVYSHQGSARIEDGPKRLFLWRERCSMLVRHSANQNEYLIVKHRDGRIEHIQGPTVMFQNTMAHLSIKNQKMLSLDANEALVVYTQDPVNQEVKRYIKYGPTLFMPKATEWLHTFSWHGTDPNNKTRLVPSSKHFDRLQIIPDQFYYNVDEVRTADDALIRVKLMVFYEMTDIDKMLNTTKDPIADFMNCVCADVIAFAAKNKYIEFIEHSGELNELTSYPQLMDRTAKIGYNISKVVFRGYLAHDKLQKLHDGAIEVRTKLKISYESEEQEQNMTDLKLKNEKDRIDLEQKIELERLTHTKELERGKVEHQLKMELQSEFEKIHHWETEKKARREGQAAVEEKELDYLKNLQGLGVDLDQYTQALSQKPEKVTRIIAASNAANLHLHHS